MKQYVIVRTDHIVFATCNSKAGPWKVNLKKVTTRLAEIVAN
jgi:hypothetical protein